MPHAERGCRPSAAGPRDSAGAKIWGSAQWAAKRSCQEAGEWGNTVECMPAADPPLGAVDAHDESIRLASADLVAHLRDLLGARLLTNYTIAEAMPGQRCRPRRRARSSTHRAGYMSRVQEIPRSVPAHPSPRGPVHHWTRWITALALGRP
jgi:hypothetical protein